MMSDDGIQLGRLRAAWNQPLGEIFSAHVEASTWDDDDKNPIDLTEAYLEYRPYPRAGWRTRVRLGAFYPPMSLESRAIGWETPYTITPSAISSWIGEEIRTIGLEAQVDWLGTRLGHSFDFQLTGARVRLERPGWHHARQCTASRCTTGRPRCSGESAPLQTRPRNGEEGTVPRDRRPPRFLRGRAGALPGSRDAQRPALRQSRRSRGGGCRDARLRLEDALRCRGSAHRNRRTTGPYWCRPCSGDTEINPLHVAHLGIRLTIRAASQNAGARHMLAARYDCVRNRIRPVIRPRPAAKTGNAWAIAYSFDHGEHWRVRARVAARRERRAGAHRG